MATRSASLSSACLLLGFALLCGLQNSQGFPSIDEPLPYPAGVRRSAGPASLESDETLDEPQGPPTRDVPVPPADPIGGPALNPLLPLIRLKPGKLGPVVDPTQFIQLKAELLKNLYGPGGIKSPVARATSSGASKWAGGAAWASGSKSSTSAKGKPSSKSAKPTSKPWDWPPPISAAAPADSVAPQSPPSWGPAPPAPQGPASWGPAPSAPQAPPSWAPAPPAPASWGPAPAAPAPAAPAPASSFPSVPGYWIPTSVFPAPADPEDKKTALVEALLDQLLNPPPQSSSLRLARAPVDSASTGPSPYLTDLLNSLNLTAPDTPASLTPTIEPPGFWFPSVVPAAPGSLLPFAVDPTAQLAKKNKFLGDLFTTKIATKAATKAANKAAFAAAIAAALAPPTSAPAPASSLATREIGSVELSQVSTYISNLLDSVTDASNPAKRALGIAPKKGKPAKPAKAPKTSKIAKPIQVVTQTEDVAPAIPPVIDEVPEDEATLDQILGLRMKREIGDETEEPEEPEVPTDATSEADAAAEKAKASAALLNDMATVKQNILIQLDALSKAQSAASKAVKVATKANKKASSLATLLNLPIPTTTPLPAVPIADYQQKIALLTNIYSTLSDTQKNLTSAPDAKDPLNPDKLFIAAVNTKVAKIAMRNALLPTAPKVARSNNSNWQRWRGQQEAEAPSQQYEADNETSRRQKSAVPLVAAVFAPQTHTYSGRQPYWWN